jgi:hypothetical protein
MFLLVLLNPIFASSSPTWRTRISETFTSAFTRSLQASAEYPYAFITLSWRLSHSRAQMNSLNPRDKAYDDAIDFFLDFWEGEAYRRAREWDMAGAQDILRAASDSSIAIARAVEAEVVLFYPEYSSLIDYACDEQVDFYERTAFQLDHLPDEPWEATVVKMLRWLSGTRGPIDETNCFVIPQMSCRRQTRLNELIAFSVERNREVLHVANKGLNWLRLETFPSPLEEEDDDRWKLLISPELSDIEEVDEDEED